MGSPPADKLYTIPEYIALEVSTGLKHEYCEGVVTAMAGASPAHCIVAGNILGVFRDALKGKSCRPFNSDLKIRSGQKLHYPDASIICRPIRFDPELPDAVLNPRIVFEVISPSTEAYDRGEKFALYRQNEEMTDYVLVSPDRVYAEHYMRAPNGSWNLTFLGPGSTLTLPSIECEVALDSFYEGLDILS